MASSVYHVGLGLELNLTEPDLGHPEWPGLWQRLRSDRRPVSERQLQCMQCRETRPDCPEWMFLTERDGVRFATHHNASIDDHEGTNESDQHKAFKERIATAAETGGFTVEIEDRAAHGRRRTDVLVHGVDDLLVGHEVQLSYASLDSVKKRAKQARTDGITPLWTTVDAKRDFINQVPWALTDDVSWKHISMGRDLQIRGGVRTLEMERCDITNPRPCPVRVRGKCGKLHGRWVPMFPYMLDDLVRETAGGIYVPVIIPGKRMHFRWWVRADDRDRYADSAGGLLAEEDLGRRRRTETPVQTPRPIEDDCRYGQDSGIRSAPTGPREDDGAADAAVVTVDDRPTPPPMPTIRRGMCGVGPGPCGKSPARLYASGWRCEEHKP